MGQGRDDLMALLRYWRFGLGLPAAARYGWHMFAPLREAYDTTVAPVVACTVGDARERARTDRALRAMSVKIGETMVGYACLVGREPQLEIAALAGAVTRLYDDLIDGSDEQDASLDERLGDLLAARPFVPRSDLERLLARLIVEIRGRLDLATGDVPVTALITLHEYQCLSRRQRDADVPPAMLDKICRGKGAMANLTLCGLVHPGMNAVEQDVVMSLGEALQSLDDYMDVTLDARNGVATLTSLGMTTLADITARADSLRGAFAALYGGAATRQYYGMIYFLLLKSAVGRRLPILGRVASRFARRSDTLAFLTRGAEVIP